MPDSLVVTGIGELGLEPGPAAMLVEDGRVTWAGPQPALPEQAGDERVDVEGRAVIPGFVDSHTHLVFGGHRAAEWEARMAGRPYAAGGILTTVRATRATSEEELSARTRRLAAEALLSGTTTLEVKSGYALEARGEQRLLRIGGEVTDECTFLGAHVVAPEYAGRTDEYVELVAGRMLDACAPLARWADVFCEERGAFDADQARHILAAAAARGLGLRVHGNQLGPGPGVALAVELGAASVDHCTHLSDADVEALAGSGTVATLLPGAEFSTRSPYPDARRLLDAGVRVALATDCNPGTSFTSSMPFVIALAVREMRMTLAEALAAATEGGAAALRRDDVGALRPGCRADFLVLEAPTAQWIGYRPGVDIVRTIVREGERVAGSWPFQPPSGGGAGRR